ncbi:hypothetical protein LCM17_01730 [Cereibacter sphaeroides]|nr:hypothetical protein [Cereibacter sphaeroides]
MRVFSPRRLLLPVFLSSLTLSPTLAQAGSWWGEDSSTLGSLLETLPERAFGPRAEIGYGDLAAAEGQQQAGEPASGLVSRVLLTAVGPTPGAQALVTDPDSTAAQGFARNAVTQLVTYGRGRNEGVIQLDDEATAALPGFLADHGYQPLADGVWGGGSAIVSASALWSGPFPRDVALRLRGSDLHYAAMSQAEALMADSDGALAGQEALAPLVETIDRMDEHGTAGALVAALLYPSAPVSETALPWRALALADFAEGDTATGLLLATLDWPVEGYASPVALGAELTRLWREAPVPGAASLLDALDGAGSLSVSVLDDGLALLQVEVSLPARLGRNGFSVNPAMDIWQQALVFGELPILP